MREKNHETFLITFTCFVHSNRHIHTDGQMFIEWMFIDQMNLYQKNNSLSKINLINGLGHWNVHYTGTKSTKSNKFSYLLD